MSFGKCEAEQHWEQLSFGHKPTGMIAIGIQADASNYQTEYKSKVRTERGSAPRYSKRD
jgi:hypothetical protein